MVDVKCKWKGISDDNNIVSIAVLNYELNATILESWILLKISDLQTYWTSYWISNIFFCRKLIDGKNGRGCQLAISDSCGVSYCDGSKIKNIYSTIARAICIFIYVPYRIYVCTTIPAVDFCRQMFGWMVHCIIWAMRGSIDYCHSFWTARLRNYAILWFDVVKANWTQRLYRVGWQQN